MTEVNFITTPPATVPVFAPPPWTVALCLLSALILAVGAGYPLWLSRHPMTVLGWSSLFGGIAFVRLVRIQSHARRHGRPVPVAMPLAIFGVAMLTVAHAFVAGLYLWVFSRGLR